jgi:tRNA(fMet)-specific endonuclease VapC
MMYLLDTNTLIYYFKGMGNVAKRLLSTSPSEIALSTIVLFELEVGIAKSMSPRKRKAQLQEFTSLVNIVSFDRAAAELAAEIRAKLEKRGVLIGPYDILVAASALATNSTLVTHNTKEFERVESLRIEDWY